MGRIALAGGMTKVFDLMPWAHSFWFNQMIKTFCVQNAIWLWLERTIGHQMRKLILGIKGHWLVPHYSFATCLIWYCGCLFELICLKISSFKLFVNRISICRHWQWLAWLMSISHVTYCFIRGNTSWVPAIFPLPIIKYDSFSDDCVNHGYGWLCSNIG